MPNSTTHKPKPRKPSPRKRVIVAKRQPATSNRTLPPATPESTPPKRLVRILASNRVGGRITPSRFVLVCLLEGDRIVDGEWFGKQVDPNDEIGEFGIIVREGREILYPAGYWRTNIGQKPIIPGELFSVFGENKGRTRDDGDDVWEITHVTSLATT